MKYIHILLMILWFYDTLEYTFAYFSYFSNKQEVMPVMFENGTVKDVLIEHEKFLEKKWQVWNVSTCKSRSKSLCKTFSISEMMKKAQNDSFCDIMNLHPSDIHVVMALGDSITAGFVAENSTNVYNPLHLTEHLGISYATGGNHDAISLLNLFDAYQPLGRKINGASHGMKNIAYHMVFLGYKVGYHEKINGLNAAFTDSTSQDLVYQIQYLNETFKSIPEIDLNHDWKLLILYMGSNDLCISDYCTEPEDGKPGNVLFYEKNLRESLEILRKTFPRTIVLLVDIMYFIDLDQWTSQLPQCESLRWIQKHFCPCMVTKEGRDYLREKKIRMTSVLKSLANEYQIKVQYDTFKTHTRHYRSSPTWSDPGFKNQNTDANDGYYIPKYSDFGIIFYEFPIDLFDMNHPGPYVSELDCIHPSRFAHETLAVNFWNNLFLPSHKRKIILTKDPIYCPGEYDRIMLV